MIKRLIDFMLYWEFITAAIVLIPWALGVSIIFLKVMYTYRNWIWEGMDGEKRFYWVKVGKW